MSHHRTMERLEKGVNHEKWLVKAIIKEFWHQKTILGNWPENSMDCCQRRWRQCESWSWFATWKNVKNWMNKVGFDQNGEPHAFNYGGGSLDLRDREKSGGAAATVFLTANCKTARVVKMSDLGLGAKNRNKLWRQNRLDNSAGRRTCWSTVLACVCGLQHWKSNWKQSRWPQNWIKVIKANIRKAYKGLRACCCQGGQTDIHTHGHRSGVGGDDVEERWGWWWW